MLMDSKWAVRTTAGEVTSSDLRETFSITTATDYVSRIIDLKAAGYVDGGAPIFLHVNRVYGATYTKNALSNLRVSVMHADAASGTAYNSTLTSPVEAAAIDIPVATIDAGYELCRLPLPPGLKRYVAVKFTNTGAATALSVSGRFVTN